MEDFIKMLSMLSAKLVEQQECLTGRDRTITELSAKLVEQQECLTGHDRTITDREDQIDDLRKTLARREEDHSHSMEEMQRKYWDMRIRAGNLQLKLSEALRLAPDVNAKAGSYMETTGQHFTVEVDGKRVPAKIDAIKGVRSLTGWGLRESRDYVEAWFATHKLV